MTISLKSTVAAPVAAYPALKSSIVLFDCNPGTRSWTVPEGVSQIRAFVVGGGGGGLYTGTYASGAGGGYAEKVITVTPGQIISYTVGAGGNIGTPTGNSGGTSSFGSVISATGGGGGPESGSAAGGSGTGGDINKSGGNGSAGTSGGGGGGAGHAYGNGSPGSAQSGGGFNGLRSTVDGWGIGMLPGGD